MNKEALKEVALFWGVASLLLGFVGLTTFLTMNFGTPGFIIPIGLLMLVSMSMMVYTTSPAHNKEPKKKRKR